MTTQIRTHTHFSYMLRPYQQVADEWLEAHPRSIYADDTGLGKTPTTMAIIARHLPALVVAPAYLAYNWYLELCAALPHATISLPEGTRPQKQRQLLEPADVYVVNYDSLRTLKLPHTESLVFDEAHRLRNHRATQSKAAAELCRLSARVHLLTGTPYYKSDEDIWHLLYCVDPNAFSSYWDFIRRWYVVNWNAAYAPKIYGISKSKRAAFDALLSEHMLIRTYEDVGRQLPPLVERAVTFELPAALRKEYARLKRDWQLLGEPIESVGSVYYLLRQLTMCHVKLETVSAIVDTIPSDPVLVYTWYLESAHTLAAHFKRGQPTETPVLLITGETPPTERARMLADQKRTGYPRIIVATISALQEGQNMEHIRHMVYAEETYVKGEHTQTLARTRRDRGDSYQEGIQPPVNVYYVRARRTVDEHIPYIRDSRGNAGDHELARRLATEKD